MAPKTQAFQAAKVSDAKPKYQGASDQTDAEQEAPPVQEDILRLIVDGAHRPLPSPERRERRRGRPNRVAGGLGEP
ncbi:hypothetical protein ACU4GR_02610 [Methylobacterium oryzae CBMB20]